MSQPTDPKGDSEERLVAYLDGELEEGEADAVEAELARDGSSRRQADSLQRAWDMLDLLEMPRPSVEFSRQTVQLATQAIPQHEGTPSRPKRRWPTTLLWVAGLIVALGVGIALGRSRPFANAQIIDDQALLERYETYRAAGSADFLRRLEKEHLLDAMDQL